jgi:hypothetical protein
MKHFGSLPMYEVGDRVEFRADDGRVINGVVTWVETDMTKEYTIRVAFTDVPVVSFGVASEGVGE